jgi:hypothetical protein
MLWSEATSSCNSFDLGMEVAMAEESVLVGSDSETSVGDHVEMQVLQNDDGDVDCLKKGVGATLDLSESRRVIPSFLCVHREKEWDTSLIEPVESEKVRGLTSVVAFDGCEDLNFVQEEVN